MASVADMARLYRSRWQRDSAAMLVLFLLSLAPVATPPPDEVVVTAHKRKCQLSIADRIVRDKEFRARAAAWATGTPVRVVIADGASYRCLARIVFRLNEYGVTRVNFDPPH